MTQNVQNYSLVGTEFDVGQVLPLIRQFDELLLLNVDIVNHHHGATGVYDLFVVQKVNVVRNPGVQVQYELGLEDWQIQISWRFGKHLVELRKVKCLSEFDQYISEIVVAWKRPLDRV